MSIESLFNNPDRVNNTNYKPFYQRNYVWDDEKATYFIESILIGTEIPPLIYYRNLKSVEVVDGRQRYETILRFINGDFKLKKNGLQKLENIRIANRGFKDLGQDLQDLFWDTKLRIIEFSWEKQLTIFKSLFIACFLKIIRVTRNVRHSHYFISLIYYLDNSLGSPHLPNTSFAASTFFTKKSSLL